MDQIMDDAKKTESPEGENEIKTTTIAVDTGRRVDVGGLNQQRSTVRRRPIASTQPQAKRDEQSESHKQVHHEEMRQKSHPTFVKRAEIAPEKTVPLYVEPLEIDESGDFAAMFDESERESASQNISVKIGDKVSGKIIHIGKDNIFVALGPKLEASMARNELCNEAGEITVRMGQKISAYVVSVSGGVTLSNQVAQAGMDMILLEEAAAKKIPVEAKVISVNKGGFEIQIAGRRAFCPVGQIDDKFVEDTSTFVGKTLSFIVERIEEGGRNIVVSRRALLSRDKKEKALETIKTIEVNKRFDAVITRVADFGAFADIGGIEGMIPRSEISFGRIEKLTEVVSSGDRVEVVVMNFEINESEPQKSRLTLSLKKTKEDPYTLHWSKITVGATLEGRVVRLENFGAFVELFPGIDGLIHISELSESRVTHPKEVLNLYDPVSVRVVTVDEETKRIGLSLREAVTRKKDAQAANVTNAKIARGQKASGVVSRVERYGIFLELDSGVTALLPQSETDLPKHADLHRAFAIGSKLDVVVIDVDAQNRVRVSLTGRKAMEEQDRFLEFKSDAESKDASFGTFADILKKKR